MNKCNITTVRDNILTSINNSYGSMDQYINVWASTNEIFLYGYTKTEAEYDGIKQAAELLIRNGGCEDVRLDTCHFYKSPPPTGHPILLLSGSACGPGYKKCGSICIPDDEECFIKSRK